MTKMENKRKEGNEINKEGKWKVVHGHTNGEQWLVGGQVTTMSTSTNVDRSILKSWAVQQKLSLIMWLDSYAHTT